MARQLLLSGPLVRATAVMVFFFFVVILQFFLPALSGDVLNVELAHPRQNLCVNLIVSSRAVSNSLRMSSFEKKWATKPKVPVPWGNIIRWNQSSQQYIGTNQKL